MTASPSARLSRSAAGLLAALLGALLLAGVLFGGGPAAAPRPPYALDSAQPDGLLALVRWLERLDYDVATLDSAAPPAEDDALLFIWPGTERYTPDEAAALERWVHAGGTLALIGPGFREQALATRFGVRLGESGGPGGGPSGPLSRPTLAAQQPLVPDGPTGYGALVRSPLDLDDAPAAVAVIGAPGRPTVAVQRLGTGRIWHFAPQHDFTNERLADSADRAFMAPLVRHVPAGGRVRLDAYHLGVEAAADGGDGTGTLRGWLWASGPGRAVLWLAALAFAALALAGVRLGPPLPFAAAGARRTEAEFVTAMAALHRRAGDRALVADHARARLLGRAGKDDLDAATAARVEAAVAGLAAARDEAAVLRWVVEADDILTALNGGTKPQATRGRRR
ncbi:MAG: DUF4350 domain-containing protein [Ardenticatenales bacterium]|nr:DUF4350 domain-containing protein [Ardenticatenales bacterium]